MAIADRLLLPSYALGIFVSWAVFGIFQESVVKSTYGNAANPEKFTFTQALVFVQMLVNLLFSRLVLFYTGALKNDLTPRKVFIPMALTYLGAMFASNYALQYVNYPTQVIGKSIKPIPVMIWGALIGRKHYPLRKYLFILLVVVGVALFLYTPNKPHKSTEKASSASKLSSSKTTSEESSSIFGLGEAILLLSLLFDGLTGGQQDRLMATQKTDPHLMMLALNLCGAVYLFLPLLLTGELMDFVAFSLRNPIVWQRLLLLSLFSAIGQHFIFLTITRFGPLVCSIVTTTRKFFTVLASVVLFGHPLFAHQWLGTLAVFGGLMLDALWGKAPGHAHAHGRSASPGTGFQQSPGKERVREHTKQIEPLCPLGDLPPEERSAGERTPEAKLTSKIS